VTTEVSPHQLDIDGFTQGRPYVLVLPCADVTGGPVTPVSAVLYVWDMLGGLVATITGLITVGRVEFDLADLMGISIAKRTVYRHEIVLSAASSLKGTFGVRPQGDGHGTSDPRTTWPIMIAAGVVSVPVNVALLALTTTDLDGGNAAVGGAYDLDGGPA
jgi:hypothetical protein